MALKRLVVLFCILWAGIVAAQITLIPDPVFEQRLIDQGIDTDGTINGQVLTDDIDHITILDVSTGFPFTTFINDLTGIEDFVAMEELQFAINKISSVDLTNLTNLKLLNCKQNNLTSLNLSNNSLLEVLDASNCFPGTCTEENTYTNLDLSNNSNLESIFITNVNTITTLDLGSNPMLFLVTASRNSNLSLLNLKNGNNTILTLFQAVDNPNLFCITVDDPAAATAGTDPPYDNWEVDPQIIFSDDCSLGVSDYSLNEYITFYPNPVDRTLFVQNTSSVVIEQLAVVNVLGQNVFRSKFLSGSIDLSEISPGVYFVHLVTNLGVVRKKILKK